MNQPSRQYRGLAIMKVGLYVLAGMCLAAGVVVLASGLGFAASLSNSGGLGMILNALVGSTLGSAIATGAVAIAVLSALQSAVLFAAGKLVALVLALTLRVQRLEQTAASKEG